MEAPKEIYISNDHHGWYPENDGGDKIKYIRADLAELTREDMRKIDDIMGEVWHEAKHGDLNDNFYQEVLRRFLESKKEDQL